MEKPEPVPAGPVRLWLAQGFGIGRIPVAAGTFGSILGLGWFGLLLASGNLWVFLAGTLAGVALSVWLCGEGERILQKKDPGSVVLDEVAAIPFCFLAWVGCYVAKTGSLPGPGYFWAHGNWLSTLGVFALFRIFDIAKPWPVKQSQSIPGGWGITVDDLLAAGYVNLVVALVWAAWKLMA
jgi:phosphatidylglycerophosphatase A